MTDDEVTNDIVAEKVMGWTKVEGIGWRRDSLHIRHGDFSPMNDVAHDFVIFEHVGTWRDSHLNIRWHRFYKKLLELWQSRDWYWPYGANSEQIYWLHHYKPGDYSRAALMAIEMEAT